MMMTTMTMTMTIMMMIARIVEGGREWETWCEGGRWPITRKRRPRSAPSLQLHSLGFVFVAPYLCIWFCVFVFVSLYLCRYMCVFGFCVFVFVSLYLCHCICVIVFVSLYLCLCICGPRTTSSLCLPCPMYTLVYTDCMYLYSVLGWYFHSCVCIYMMYICSVFGNYHMHMHCVVGLCFVMTCSRMPFPKIFDCDVCLWAWPLSCCQCDASLRAAQDHEWMEYECCPTLDSRNGKSWQDLSTGQWAEGWCGGFECCICACACVCTFVCACACVDIVLVLVYYNV